METPTEFIHHDHRLTISSGFAFRCYWCKTGGYISNGYHCTKCDIWFHKDCANVKFSRELCHTSHPNHLLKQIKLDSWKVYLCEVCRRLIDDDWGYQCSICDNFCLHNSCAIEPPPLTIKHAQTHDHPLVLFLVSSNPYHLCEACKKNILGKLAYICFKCEVVFHVECVNSREVNHPCHRKHALKLLISGAPNYTYNTCLLCGLKFEDMLYHCSICNFNLCLVCASIPPPVDVEHSKTHDHKLTLMARQISFICNVCGMQGNYSPYFCLHCDFLVHRGCINLPCVININRHDHRIYHTQQLGNRDCVCKVCLQSVNQFYGAYTCSVCLNYVVHSQCATRNDVWDGIELGGIPEKIEDIMPFSEVGDNLINHFSHENHSLELNKDGTTYGESIRCEACMLPIYSDINYNCEKCGYTLHKVCANLPRKKQHMFNNKPFTLHIVDMDSPKILPCSACGEFFSGFRYESDDVVLDIRCILTSDLFSLEKHEHPLLYNKTYIGKCDACHESVNFGAYSCGSCDYNLDFCCASLPKIVHHIYDQHPLSLFSKKNVSRKYYCDICEEEMDPNKWFYTCNDCEVAMHVKCVLGDLSRLKPGQVFKRREGSFVVIPNYHSSRPFCSRCDLRCTTPFIIDALDYLNLFFCSQRCLNAFDMSMRYGISGAIQSVLNSCLRSSI